MNSARQKSRDFTTFGVHEFHLWIKGDDAGPQQEDGGYLRYHTGCCLRHAHCLKGQVNLGLGHAWCRQEQICSENIRQPAGFGPASRMTQTGI